MRDSIIIPEMSEEQKEAIVRILAEIYAEQYGLKVISITKDK